MPITPLPPSLRTLLVLLLGLAGALPSPAQAASGNTPDFHSEVAPILRDYCAGCHSAKNREGELNLETFRALKTGGENGSPLPEAPGKPSLLAKVIRGEKPAMPPKKEPQPTAAELAVLEAWLKAGAPGPSAEDVSILRLVTVPDLPLQTAPSKAITAAALAPDGKSLALARYKSVELLDPNTRTTRARSAPLPGKVTQLAFSPDGKRLAAASGISGILGKTVCWDGDGKNGLEFEEGHSDLIYAMAWSPDGKLLATGGYDHLVLLWDTSSGKLVRTLKGHNGAVFSVSFNPDGSLLASASGDQTVKIWRVRDGERLDTLKEPQGQQFSVAFTPDGNHLVAGGFDKRLRIWSLKSRDKAEINPLVESRYAHEGTITALRVLPGGDRLVSAAMDRSMKVWSLPGLELLHVLPEQADSVSAILLPPGERNPKNLLIARMDGSLDHLPLPLSTPTHPGAAPQASPAQTAHVPGTTSSTPPDTRPATAPNRVDELEPNNAPAQAQRVALPAEIRGLIDKPGDTDVFRFKALRGEEWVFEVFASREKSPLDSRIRVRDAEGRPIEHTVLQSLRSSWLTFRGKNSTDVDDFRIQHFPEMELNEFLYCNGEVVKLWHYPRGPDSGFLVYPGSGNRHTYFGTSPITHPVGQFVYTVRPLPAGSEPPNNGLPVFRLHYENDDDPSREGGQDSTLHFTAPAEGDYLLDITDTRGFGSPKSTYRLVGRRPQPDFSLNLTKGSKAAVSPGSGREFELTLKRRDSFSGEVRVDIENLPPGFHATTPIVVEAGQITAAGAIYADPDAPAPAPDAVKHCKLVATATVQGTPRKHEFPGFEEIKLGAKPKLTVEVLGSTPAQKQVELTIHPGETISARIRAQRLDFKERVELGRLDSGLNLPHGVYVDNVGLNGLLIPENETEREFFLTAAKWVPESERLVIFRAKGDGGQAAPPVLLRVRRK